MNTTKNIAMHILEVYEGGNWSDVNIKDVLQDVNFKEATTTSKASYNTIAALVCHLSFYNDVARLRLTGINPVVNKENGFDMPAIKNENDWNRMKDKNILSARLLADAARDFPEDTLFEPTVTGHSTHYKLLHGIAEHAHYHLGQIVLLKKLVKRRDEKIKNRSSL